MKVRAALLLIAFCCSPAAASRRRAAMAAPARRRRATSGRRAAIRRSARRRCRCGSASWGRASPPARGRGATRDPAPAPSRCRCARRRSTRPPRSTACRAGASFFICARSHDQRWFGIVYDEGGTASERCGVAAPIAAAAQLCGALRRGLGAERARSAGLGGAASAPGGEEAPANNRFGLLGSSRALRASSLHRSKSVDSLTRRRPLAPH